MKKTLWMVCLISLLSNFSFAQNEKIKNGFTAYFDENYNPITEEAFENRKWKNNLLAIQGDLINQKILVSRERQGFIENKINFDYLLSAAINLKIDSSKTIVIIYHPGKDACNSSGKITSRSRKIWFDELERKVYKITQTKPIYIYKDKEGTEQDDGIITWYKDANQTIEKLFFNRHYPCSSFVVISKEGRFFSYFGEFSKEMVWNTAKILTNK
jgi:hypothetical protein